MKKTLLQAGFLLFFSLLLSSCNTERQVISDLRKLDSELQRGEVSSYHAEDWQDFAKRYGKVLKKQQKCNFTNEELAEVSELNARIVKNSLAKGSTSFLGRLGGALSGLLRGLGLDKEDAVDLKELFRDVEGSKD